MGGQIEDGAQRCIKAETHSKARICPPFLKE